MRKKDKQQLLVHFDYFTKHLPLWKADRDNLTLTADNMKLYYRERYSEWRLKDNSVEGNLDLIVVNPFSEFDIAAVKKHASRYHKAP